jgi:hypothetical protein
MSLFDTGKTGNNGNGFKKGRRDSITGFTIGQVEEACEHPQLNRWIYRGSKRRRRMRMVLSLIWYYEMKENEWYTTEQICQMCLEHDARGTSAMVITNQRIGTLFRVFIAREMVQYRVVRGKREYKKGEKNENEML